MDRLFRELAPRGLSLVLVDLGEDRETVREAVRARGYRAPVLLDRGGDVANLYGVNATPTTFVIGRDGRLLGRAIGPRPWTETAGRALLDAVLRR
jgi:AhpC/TSA family protein